MNIITKNNYSDIAKLTEITKEDIKKEFAKSPNPFLYKRNRILD